MLPEIAFFFNAYLHYLQALKYYEYCPNQEVGASVLADSDNKMYSHDFHL